MFLPFDGISSVSMEDPHFELISHAWSQMTRLLIPLPPATVPMISGNGNKVASHDITTLSLQVLARCSTLTNLHIHIEHLDLLPEDQLPEHSISPLRMLHLPTAHGIASPEELARQIVRLFPRLDMSDFPLAFCPSPVDEREAAESSSQVFIASLELLLIADPRLFGNDVWYFVDFGVLGSPARIEEAGVRCGGPSYGYYELCVVKSSLDDGIHQESNIANEEDSDGTRNRSMVRQ